MGGPKFGESSVRMAQRCSAGSGYAGTVVRLLLRPRAYGGGPTDYLIKRFPAFLPGHAQVPGGARTPSGGITWGLLCMALLVSPGQLICIGDRPLIQKVRDDS
jgi:hypothetical protein